MEGMESVVCGVPEETLAIESADQQSNDRLGNDAPKLSERMSSFRELIINRQKTMRPANTHFRWQLSAETQGKQVR